MRCCPDCLRSLVASEPGVSFVKQWRGEIGKGAGDSSSGAKDGDEGGMGGVA